MNIETKQEILNYLKNHNDNSEDAIRLIREMEYECNYADCDVFSVSTEDLEQLCDSAKTKLEKVFGKSVSECGAEECQRVADAIADMLCEEYGENINNAIEYEL